MEFDLSGCKFVYLFKCIWFTFKRFSEKYLGICSKVLDLNEKITKMWAKIKLIILVFFFFKSTFFFQELNCKMKTYKHLIQNHLKPLQLYCFCVFSTINNSGHVHDTDWSKCPLYIWREIQYIKPTQALTGLRIFFAMKWVKWHLELLLE